MGVSRLQGKGATASFGAAAARVPAAHRRRALEVLKLLRRDYGDAKTALTHENAFQLLVATVLSAQCTDARVNQVTPALFARYPGPVELGRAELPELEELIHSTGFFRSKAKNLRALSRELMTHHGGDIPPEREMLVNLPGVGRKTANVVLGSWFGQPALPVDTHVSRLSQRLALTGETSPEGIERDLMALYKPRDWTFLSHGLILHGRQVCKARRPACDACALRKSCPWPDRPS